MALGRGSGRHNGGRAQIGCLVDLIGSQENRQCLEALGSKDGGRVQIWCLVDLIEGLASIEDGRFQIVCLVDLVGSPEITDSGSGERLREA